MQLPLNLVETSLSLHPFLVFFWDILVAKRVISLSTCLLMLYFSLEMFFSLSMFSLITIPLILSFLLLLIFILILHPLLHQYPALHLLPPLLPLMLLPFFLPHQSQSHLLLLQFLRGPPELFILLHILQTMSALLFYLLPFLFL